MPSNPDFKDLFKLFNDEGVEYLVAGAHADLLDVTRLEAQDSDHPDR